MDQQTTPTIKSATEIKTSGMGKLDVKDLGKGLLMAVGMAVATALYDTLNQGSLVFDWKKIAISGGLAGLVYLLKNFFTPSQTIVKLLIPLLLIGSMCQAQSFLEPIPKPVNYLTKGARVVVPVINKTIMCFRWTGLTALYALPSSALTTSNTTPQSTVFAGTGISYGKYNYNGTKYTNVYSVNLGLYEGGQYAPKTVQAVTAVGLSVSLLNQHLVLGALYNFSTQKVMAATGTNALIVPTN